MTPHALAEVRHQQATAELAAAESELIDCMKATEPDFTGSVDAMRDRRWEARIEGPKPYWELAMAHSSFRRAERSEAKARSAAHMARLTAVPAAPAAPSVPRRRKATRKTTFAAHLEEARAA